MNVKKRVVVMKAYRYAVVANAHVAIRLAVMFARDKDVKQCWELKRSRVAQAKRREGIAWRRFERAGAAQREHAPGTTKERQQQAAPSPDDSPSGTQPC